MTRTAIVVGATGLVGRALVDQLAVAPHVARVVTLTRRPYAHGSARVTNHVVDFEQLDRSAELLRGDWLFSALGTTRRDAGSIEAQRRVDVDYQLEAAKLAAANGVGHYLLVSSASAEAASSNAYLKMKGELEEAVSSLGFARVSIFQPSVLMGERASARPMERLAGVILNALSFLPGVRSYRPISGEQVAAKMIRASARSGPPREVFSPTEMFEP